MIDYKTLQRDLNKEQCTKLLKIVGWLEIIPREEICRFVWNCAETDPTGKITSEVHCAKSGFGLQPLLEAWLPDAFLGLVGDQVRNELYGINMGWIWDKHLSHISIPHCFTYFLMLFYSLMHLSLQDGSDPSKYNYSSGIMIKTISEQRNKTVISVILHIYCLPVSTFVCFLLV